MKLSAVCLVALLGLGCVCSGKRLLRRKEDPPAEVGDVEPATKGIAAAVTPVKKGPSLPDPACGKGFDKLNPGSQEYFHTVEKGLWTHPGRNEQFGTFEAELKCWFSHLLTTQCGGLPSQAGARKKQLAETCNDPHKDWIPVWKMYSKDEFQYYKRNFPNDAQDAYGAGYKETQNTLMELNKKEVLCMTLFVIDDECVKHKYIKLPGVTMPAMVATKTEMSVARQCNAGTTQVCVAHGEDATGAPEFTCTGATDGAKVAIDSEMNRKHGARICGPGKFEFSPMQCAGSRFDYHKDTIEIKSADWSGGSDCSAATGQMVDIPHASCYSVSC